MNIVTLTEISAYDALARKRDLDDAGLIFNQDYTWKYQPVKYSSWGCEPKDQSQVVFEFVNPALASFYQIKWSK